MKERTSIPPVWLCWFTCLGGLASYFWADGDHVTSAVVSFVAVTGLAGYWLGGSVILAFLAALTSGGLFATKLAEVFGPVVGDFFGTSGILNSILATCIGCITIGIVAMLVVEIVWKRLLGKRGHQWALNQSFGLSLGAIHGAVLSLMILGGVVVAEPHARSAVKGETETVQVFMRQCTANSILKTGQALRSSPIGPFIRQFNPFEHVPQLRQLSQLPASESPSEAPLRRKPRRQTVR